MSMMASRLQSKSGRKLRTRNKHINEYMFKTPIDFKAQPSLPELPNDNLFSQEEFNKLQQLQIYVASQYFTHTVDGACNHLQ